MRRLNLLALPLLVAACGDAPAPVSIEVWYGDEQRVGHLGDAQDDFNLLGVATGDRVTYRVGDGAAVELALGEGEHGFRRLAGPGHFNADVAIASLAPGANLVHLVASNHRGERVERTVRVDRLDGESPLPCAIRWGDVAHPQEVGQVVDGLWRVEDDGLRAPRPGYDRLFLVGSRAWSDYEAATSVAVHAVAAETPRQSGGPGVGLVLRFAGHTVGGPLDFPDAQPKWGYLPFGAIVWLRWERGAPDEDPVRQFYRGDRNELTDHAALAFEPGRTYALRASCRTTSAPGASPATTVYRFKVWPEDEPEPDAWDLEETLVSDVALTAGGLALVAHHVDATFGDVRVEPLGDGAAGAASR